jgi:hypothetical protein
LRSCRDDQLLILVEIADMRSISVIRVIGDESSSASIRRHFSIADDADDADTALRRLSSRATGEGPALPYLLT